MDIWQAKLLLESVGYLLENKNDIVRYHIIKKKYLDDTLQNGINPVSGKRGKNTADYRTMKPGVWLSGNKDFIPVFRTLADEDKVLLKITMPLDFYMSHEREYWPYGRTNDSVIVSSGEPPMDSREGRTYVEKFNGYIPSEYITVESDIGRNRKGDKQVVEYYRYIADELMGGDFDSDDFTDKEIEYMLRNMPISKRKAAYDIEGINISTWKPGQLPEFER